MEIQLSLLWAVAGSVLLSKCSPSRRNLPDETPKGQEGGESGSGLQ